MGILLMQVGRGVSWHSRSHLEPQRFLGPVCGSWIPPPATSSIWGPSHACLSPWAPSPWPPSPSTALLYATSPGSWPILPRGLVVSGSHHLHLASVILSTASHLTVDLAITHPSSASLHHPRFGAPSGLQGLVHGRLSFIRLHIR